MVPLEREDRNLGVRGTYGASESAHFCCEPTTIKKMVDRVGPGQFQVHADVVDRVARALRMAGMAGTIDQARMVINLAAAETARVMREREAANGLLMLRGDTPADARARARAYFEIPANVWAVGVVGERKAGKSALVNWLRKLPKTDPNAAKSGVLVGTDLPTLYPLNVTGVGRVQLWDTPALGDVGDGGNFPLHRMAAFDVVVVVVRDRLMERSLNAIKTAHYYGKRIILVFGSLGVHLDNHMWAKGLSKDAAFAELVEIYKDVFARRVLPAAPEALCMVYDANMMDDEETRSRMLFSMMPPKQ